MTGFAILVGEAIIGFYKKVHAINFGVYGATMVGKTTLSHQLRTRGEVPTIQDRTVGSHRASRKNVKIDGDSHTIKSADIGGEAVYWKEWSKDIEPFKYGMRQLNDKGIPCFKYIVSAKSDPEMVYRGVMTMIKDY
jgi:hypothetical protein